MHNSTSPSLPRALRRLLAGLILPAALLHGAAHAAPVPPGVTQVAAVEGITEYRLANGLRVLLAPDPSKPTTTVNMTYLVGSHHENYGETGMAHLLEHMLFKGTPTLRNALGEFSRRGMSANGSTWTDRTNYYASFAANDDNLDWYLGWQADAMVNSLIARADLDSEMTVVRNEMESGENNPFRSLMSKMLATAYQWHNYGKSTIGARADVENVDIDQLRAFYQLYYQPDNAVLIVSGQFDEARTLKVIQDTFGPLPRPTRALPRLYTVEPAQDGERSVTVRRSGGAPLLAAMYHTPPGAHPDSAAIELLSSVMGDAPSGRLYRALVESRLAAATFSIPLTMRDPGVVMFGAQLAQEARYDDARERMLATLESVARQPITQEELERARTKWLKDWELAYSNPEKVGVSLSESIAQGDWRLFFVARDRVRDVTLADVQRVAQGYLVQANRTGGTYVPTDAPVRAPLVEAPDLAATLAGYTGDPGFKQAEAFDPTPANIDARTQRKVLALPNGRASLALLPKSTRGQVVQARLTLQAGDAESLRGKRELAAAAAALLDNGTPTLTRQQIEDRFDALRADVGFSGAGTDVLVTLSTVREHLPATLRLVFQLLRDAGYPDDQVDEYQRAMLASLDNARQEPGAVASRALARHRKPWPADDLRYVPTFDEQAAAIRALTPAALRDFHRRFHGAGTLSLAVVGDFDPAQVEQAVAEGLAGWHRAPAYQRVPTPYHAVAAKRFDLPLPDKANAFYIATLPLPIGDTHADYPALVLANYLLGRSQTSRLWTRVREQEGLSYDVRSIFSASPYEASGNWQIQAIYAPANLGRLERAVSEELARALKDGFGDDEVRDGVQSLLNLRRLYRAQDGTLAQTWSDYLQQDRTFAASAWRDAQLQSLTAADVNRVLRTYLKPEAFSAAVAGTFAPAAR